MAQLLNFEDIPPMPVNDQHVATISQAFARHIEKLQEAIPDLSAADVLVALHGLTLAVHAGIIHYVAAGHDKGVPHPDDPKPAANDPRDSAHLGIA